MNKNQIEVYRYYSAVHPDAIVVVHLPGRYVVLGNGADKVTESVSTRISSDSDYAVIPDNILLLSELESQGREICLVEYRNDAGELDYPDILRLQEEKRMDS